MELKNFRTIGVFVVGMLWGIVLCYFALGMIAKKYIIIEYKTNMGVEEFSRELMIRTFKTGSWTANVSACAVPQPSDGSKINVITLCNAKIAKSIVDNYGSRKLASIIPCQFAVYQNADGTTKVSRLNFRLIGWLLGGNSAFASENAVSEQEMIFRGLIEKN